MRNLDHRVRVQILAALDLWTIFAERSDCHPSRQPEVAHYFEDVMPLTIREIRDFIDTQDAPVRRRVMLPELADKYNLKYRTLLRHVAKANIDPILRVGRCSFYNPDDLASLVKFLLRKKWYGLTE